MKLNIHSVHFTADQKLLDFIQTKANKLDTFYDRITSGEVYLRVSTDKDIKGNNKIVEVKLFVPGGSLFVKEQEASFEAATDIAVDALKAQLKRIKEKATDHGNPNTEELIPVEEDADSDLDA
jgi:putative sigma-54 modulation protein